MVDYLKTMKNVLGKYDMNVTILGINCQKTIS